MMKSKYKPLKGRRFCILPGEKSLDQWTAQISFYGKAAYREVDGVYLLRSYDTLFAAACNGSLLLTSELPLSVTTRVHVYAFCRMLGIKVKLDKSGIRKIARCELECDDPQSAASYIKWLIGNGCKAA